MNWFRSNIRHGSTLALLALGIQFVLSFGHFHAIAAQAAPAIQPDIQQAVALSRAVASRDLAGQVVERTDRGQKPASDTDSDKQAHDACAICAVIAMANAVVSAAPLLPLPQATAFRTITADAEFIDLDPLRVAFQPRGPPIS